MGLWSSFLSLFKANRNTPGARSRDLGPAAQSTPLQAGQSIGVPFDAMQAQAYNVPAGNSGAGIVQGTGADVFGPLNPMRPILPPEVAGRQWDFPIGANLAVRPRAYDSIGFAELRNLAENCDILRAVIETRKDQMAKLNWQIKPQLDEEAKKQKKTGKVPPVQKEIAAFFKKPDGENSFAGWLRILLEDLFVIDAPTLYVNRTKGGKLLSLETMDGGSFKRVIDDWGRTPAPPVPAYQQILKGMTAVDYTTDDLIYMPRVKRSFKMYGYSPTEQAAITINIAIRRALFQFEYYDSGTQPEGILSVPKEWTTDQVRQFETYWNDALSGNLEARRRMKFVPGDVAKTFIPLREPNLTGQMDEWLARVICYFFSVSSEPFVSRMNRATAETSHDAALQEGLAPIQNWVKELVDGIIERFWPSSGQEFEWVDDRQVDPKDQESVITSYVTKGVMTINEGRDQMGLDPIDGGDELRVLTATGYVKVAANDNAPDPGDVYNDQQKTAELKAKNPAPVVAPAANAGAADAGQAPTKKPKGKGAQAAKAAGSFWSKDGHAHARHAGGASG